MKKRCQKKRLYEKFKKEENGCWVFTGAKTKMGYGKFTVSHQKWRLAHRISWQVHFGSIPDKLLILHKCDNPSCVNPEHLFLGTHLDNIRDMIKKGRQNATGAKNPVRGEKHPFAKLSNNDVLSIRKDDRMHRVIAGSYGVTQPLITMIKNNKIWKGI